MTALALIASAATLVLAAIHLLWAIGYWWPIGEESALARAVVGSKNVTQMPGAVPLSLIVVGLLFAAALPWFGAGPVKATGLLLCAFVFQVRAVLTYAPFWKRAKPEQPFRRLDESYYGPLFIALGMIFMILAGRAMV